MRKVRKKRRVPSKQDIAAANELVMRNNLFAVDLYRSLADEQAGNLVFSPYGISSALAVTYPGARGTTKKQMADALVFTLPQEDLHRVFNALDYTLSPYGKKK